MGCECTLIGNTGIAIENTLQNPKKIIFTSFLKEDGTVNEIDTNVLLLRVPYTKTGTTPAFKQGETITNTVSTETGILFYDSGTELVLKYATGVVADWADTDTLTSSGGGTAVVNGTTAAFDTKENGGYNKEFWDALTNHTDTKERLFPLLNAFEIKIETADGDFQTHSDKSVSRTQNGLTTVTMMLKGKEATPRYIGKIKRHICTNLSCYIVDVCNNLAGEQITKEFLAPIRIDAESLDVKPIFAANDSTMMISVKFNLHTDFKVERLSIIEAEKIEYLPAKIDGLLDVYFEKDETDVVVTTTTATFTLATDAGTVLTPILQKGLKASDFVSSVTGIPSKIRNVTNSSDVTVTLTESPAGTYVLTYAAQPAADELIIFPKKNGRDFSAMKATIVTVP